MLFRCFLSFTYDIQTACSFMSSWRENIAIYKVCVFERVLFFCFTFWRKSSRSSHIKQIGFSRWFWNLSFIKQQHAQNVFTLFWLSHLCVSPECSLFVTYQVHWVLEMSRDKSLTHVCYIFPKPNRFLNIELQTFQAEYIRKLWQIRFMHFEIATA